MQSFIDTAQFLGAPVVRVFAGYVRPKDTREAVWRRTVEGLKRTADYAEQAGIVAAVQNHNHNNVTRTGDDVVRLLREVGHPVDGRLLGRGPAKVIIDAEAGDRQTAFHAVLLDLLEVVLGQRVQGMDVEIDSIESELCTEIDESQIV